MDWLVKMGDRVCVAVMSCAGVQSLSDMRAEAAACGSAEWVSPALLPRQLKLHPLSHSYNHSIVVYMYTTSIPQRKTICNSFHPPLVPLPSSFSPLSSLFFILFSLSPPPLLLTPPSPSLLSHLTPQAQDCLAVGGNSAGKERHCLQ